MAQVSEEYIKMAEADSDAEVPSTLYHTLLTVVDYEASSAGSIRTVYPLGTHTALASAKAFSLLALGLLGYARDDFEVYEERPASSSTDADEDDKKWTHGDGTLVYAKRTGPHEFLVGIATTPNNEGLAASRDGHAHVRLEDGREGADLLHYVLQTRVDYNVDRSGEVQQTDVEGVYAKRADAIAAAKACLVSDEVARSDFAQYDEWEADGAVADDWPFGEDVVVHAVAQTGENYLVAVRTVPGSHKKHAKHEKKH